MSFKQLSLFKASMLSFSYNFSGLINVACKLYDSRINRISHGGPQLNMSQKYSLAAEETNRTLGCIRNIVASRSRRVNLPLYSALMRPHLECCSQFWVVQFKRHADTLEGGLWRWWKKWSISHMRKSWESWNCSARKSRGSRRGGSHKYLKGGCKGEGGRSFLVELSAK